jgi:hypothetical protein
MADKIMNTLLAQQQQLRDGLQKQLETLAIRSGRPAATPAGQDSPVDLLKSRLAELEAAKAQAVKRFDGEIARVKADIAAHDERRRQQAAGRRPASRKSSA